MECCEDDTTGLMGDLSEGWGELALMFGKPYKLFKADGPNDPLAAPNLKAQFKAYFDRDAKFSGTKAADYGKPEYYAAFGSRLPVIGDYLVGEHTYFLVDWPLFLPPKVVKCNNSVSFLRPGGYTSPPMIANSVPIANAVGEPNPYFNISHRPNEGQGKFMATHWPISMMPGTKGEKDSNNLSEATRDPWFDCKCPAIPGVRIQTGDRIEDADGVHYKVSSVVPDLGLHFTVELMKVAG